MTASIRHVHSPLRATNCALSATRSMVKASTAAAMHVLFQDFRNSNQTQPSAAIALGAAKGRGYGLMIWLSCFAPPCPPCHALPLSGSPGSMIPPVRHRLKRMAGFRHCGTQKQCLALRAAARPKKSGRTHSNLAAPGHIRSHPVTPGHTRPHPAARTTGKRKCITDVACCKMILKAMTSRRVLLKHATK